MLLCVPLILSGPMADESPLVSTFSIVGFDAVNGDLGIAVQSKFPNVRPIVPWAEAGVGAVATQSFAELDYGIKGLELMANGATAEEALGILMRNDPEFQERQVGMVDARGVAASWTGTGTFPWAGGRVGTDDGSSSGEAGELIVGKGYAAQGNILVSAETVEALAETFEATEGSLADRLVAALVAGGKAGGDQRGEQSAALLVVREGAGYDGMDNFIDISVYDHVTPIAELQRLYRLNNLYFTQSDPANMIPISVDIAIELQQIWEERGFYDGPIDGTVDTEFQQILVGYMGWENYDLRIAPVQNVDLSGGDTLFIDREVLEDIRYVYREGLWKPKVN